MMDPAFLGRKASDSIADLFTKLSPSEDIHESSSFALGLSELAAELSGELFELEPSAAQSSELEGSEVEPCGLEVDDIKPT